MIPPMLGLFLILTFGCGGGDGADEPTATAKAPVAPAKAAAALKNAKKAERAPEDGWGAVFWRQATAWKVGGGDVVVGPKEAAEVRTSGDPLACKGVAAKGAPAPSEPAACGARRRRSDATMKRIGCRCPCLINHAPTGARARLCDA